VLPARVDTDHKSLNAAQLDNASATPLCFCASSKALNERLREGNRVPKAGRNLKPVVEELNDIEAELARARHKFDCAIDAGSNSNRRLTGHFLTSRASRTKSSAGCLTHRTDLERCEEVLLCSLISKRAARATT